MSLPPPYQGPGRGRPNVQSKSENESEASSDKESGPQLHSGAKAWTKMEGKLLEVPVATEKYSMQNQSQQPIKLHGKQGPE